VADHLKAVKLCCMDHLQEGRSWNLSLWLKIKQKTTRIARIS